MRRYREGKKYIDDCHHVSQAEFIWDGDGVQRCAHVLRTEDLPGAFDALMESRGYRVQLPAYVANSEKDTCPGLSARSLTPETRRLLGEVYAEDFRRLNYSAW